MRTIKFRAWDKADSEMVGVDLIVFDDRTTTDKAHILDERNDVHYLDEIELMQFTGLLDKNGVKVFEGDVVAIDEPQVKFKVVFEDGAFIFKGKYTFFPLHEAEFFEVIGNIYEHSCLLEANND